MNDQFTWFATAWRSIERVFVILAFLACATEPPHATLHQKCYRFCCYLHLHRSHHYHHHYFFNYHHNYYHLSQLLVGYSVGVVVLWNLVTCTSEVVYNSYQVVVMMMMMIMMMMMMMMMMVMMMMMMMVMMMNSLNPLSTNHTLFSTTPPPHCPPPQKLESLSYNHDGSEFISSHSDGSYIIWKSYDSSQPREAACTPYGAFVVVRSWWCVRGGAFVVVHLWWCVCSGCDKAFAMSICCRGLWGSV